jgi:hypothetical protein
MKITAKFAGALLGAMTFSGAALASIAGPTTPPGERAGLDLASPLPEGIYFVNIGSIGSWRSVKGDTGFDYNVPILAWSTPWTILGGRIQFLGALPEVSASSQSGAYIRGLYNPFVAGQIAWNVGNGFSVSYLAGAYIGIGGTNLYAGGALVAQDPFNQTTFHQQLALAWHGGGWNATANLIYNLITDSSQSGGFGVAVPRRNADAFNYDLGLTKTFGKWEVGMIAYGTVMSGGTYTDPVDGAGTRYACSGCETFALGGLVGYNFGPVITQLTVATDLYTHSDNNLYWVQKETRGVLRVIVPLWNPEAPKAVVAKY